MIIQSLFFLPVHGQHGGTWAAAAGPTDPNAFWLGWIVSTLFCTLLAMAIVTVRLRQKNALDAWFDDHPSGSVEVLTLLDGNRRAILKEYHGAAIFTGYGKTALDAIEAAIAEWHVHHDDEGRPPPRSGREIYA